jgi:Ubiquinol-cytochrome C reductase hinge protein
MADLSADELHHKVLETLKNGEDPKPFVLEWCKPQCLDWKAMLTRCEEALKIVKSAEPDKSCLYRFRQYAECVENCTQPQIFYHLVSSHNRGKLDSFFDGVWALRYLFAPLYPAVKIILAFKRINVIEGSPIE